MILRRWSIEAPRSPGRTTSIDRSLGLAAGLHPIRPRIHHATLTSKHEEVYLQAKQCAETDRNAERSGSGQGSISN